MLTAPLLVGTLIAQAVIDPTGPLLQYGSLGILAALAVLAVKVLFSRLTAELQAHKERADRLEGELRTLNSAVQERYMTTLSDATHAIADATSVIRDSLGTHRRSQ